jgi:Na+/glutamate symporter
LESKQSTSASESSKKEKKKKKKKEKKKKQKRKKLQAKDESPEDKLKAVSMVVIEQWCFIVCVAVDMQLPAAASDTPLTVPTCILCM